MTQPDSSAAPLTTPDIRLRLPHPNPIAAVAEIFDQLASLPAARTDHGVPATVVSNLRILGVDVDDPRSPRLAQVRHTRFELAELVDTENR